MYLYTGCYTEPNGQGTGVGVHRFDPETGEITTLSGAQGVPSPTFLALGPRGDALYAVAEGGTPGGSVVAYRRDPASGELTELNRQSSMGAGPCHVSVDHSGRYVLAANYGSGSIAALPIAEDGSLGEATGSVQHEGASLADPARQDGPHAHQIVPSPDGKYIFVNDLGLDRVFGYRLNLESGTLEEVPGAGTSTAAGAGPRHLAFSPDGGTVYVINELASTLGAYSYDPETGALTERVTVSTLPADFTGESYCAHVVVSPDGRFVYGSNRGHDSIAVFAVGDGEEELTLLRTVTTGITWPRNFTLTLDGEWLLVANERAHTVVAMRRDAQSGLPSEPVTEASIASPVCLVLAAE